LGKLVQADFTAMSWRAGLIPAVFKFLDISRRILVRHTYAAVSSRLVGAPAVLLSSPPGMAAHA